MRRERSSGGLAAPSEAQGARARVLHGAAPMAQEREGEVREGRDEKKRRTGRKSGWAGLVDEGDALVDEVAGGDGADEVEVAGW